MTDPIAALTARVEHLEAVAAVLALSADYCRGADQRDLPLFLSVWADDAFWQVSEEMAFRGRDEIAVAIAKQWESTQHAHHWTSNPAITVDGDSAAARFDVQTEVRLLDGSWIWIAGEYEDRYVNRDGRWWMLSRAARVLSQRAD
jgi:ketosteroid isomerase-like protein